MQLVVLTKKELAEQKPAGGRKQWMSKYLQRNKFPMELR